MHVLPRVAGGVGAGAHARGAPAGSRRASGYSRAIGAVLAICALVLVVLAVAVGVAVAAGGVGVGTALIVVLVVCALTAVVWGAVAYAARLFR